MGGIQRLYSLQEAKFERVKKELQAREDTYP